MTAVSTDIKLTSPLRRDDIHWWWLSFVDRIDHMVACHLGVALVAARNIQEAAEEAWDYRCNPGGEVMGERLPQRRMPKHITYRQLTEASDIAEAQRYLGDRS